MPGEIAGGDGANPAKGFRDKCERVGLHVLSRPEVVAAAARCPPLIVAPRVTPRSGDDTSSAAARNPGTPPRPK